MLDKLFSSKITAYDQTTIDILRLTRSENVGCKTFYALIKTFGSAASALENIAISSLKGGRNKPIQAYSIAQAEKELEMLDKNGGKLISYLDHRYSKLLREISDFPPILTYKGNIDLICDEKILSVVGARNASLNGQIFTKKLVSELSAQGYNIVSGLARGIDTAAHQVALPRTIAVIAGGIDHIYPQENAKLYEQIASEGLLLAELPIGSKPLPQHFPQRNRIISGLSLGTIVIEASLKSGSLITATMALEQNREVFAVPGFPLDPRSQGTNNLIKNGAYLVDCVDDVILNISTIKNIVNDQNFKIEKDNFIPPNSLSGIQNLADKYRYQILSKLSASPVDIELLAQELEIGLPVVQLVMLEFELAGKVKRHIGDKFSLLFTME